MPTALDLMGFDIPPGCQGRSLAPLLLGDAERVHDAVFVEFCEYRGTAVKAVRTQNWKYIYTRSVGDIPWSGDYSPGEVFRRAGLEREMLFYLADDPSESTNLAGGRTDVVAEMKSLLIDWMVDTEDQTQDL
jgi:arylsulfatase A-like enzyme